MQFMISIEEVIQIMEFVTTMYFAEPGHSVQLSSSPRMVDDRSCELCHARDMCCFSTPFSFP